MLSRSFIVQNYTIFPSVWKVLKSAAVAFGWGSKSIFSLSLIDDFSIKLATKSWEPRIKPKSYGGVLLLVFSALFWSCSYELCFSCGCCAKIRPSLHQGHANSLGRRSDSIRRPASTRNLRCDIAFALQHFHCTFCPRVLLPSLLALSVAGVSWISACELGAAAYKSAPLMTNKTDATLKASMHCDSCAQNKVRKHFRC